MKITTAMYGKRITVMATQPANADGHGHPQRMVNVMSAFVGPIKKIPVGDITENDYKGSLKISYDKETANVDSGFELSTYKNSLSGSDNIRLTSIIDRTSGERCFYIRKKATDSTEESNWVKVDVKARPEAPKQLTVEEASDNDVEDGKIVGTTIAMEYKGSGESSYTRASNNFTLVKAGNYQVRYAVTDSSFVSKTVTVKVSANTSVKKSTEDTELDTKVKVSSSSRKSNSKNRKIEKINDDDVALSGGIVDESGLWDSLPRENQRSLNRIMGDIGGELIDATALIYGDPKTSPSISVNEKPVALIIGGGAVVLEIDSIDSTVSLCDAWKVVQAVLNEEQLEYVESGSLFEIKVASICIDEAGVNAADKAIIEDGIKEYSIEHPNLSNVSYFDIAIMSNFEDGGWTNVEETYEPIEFTMELPDEYKGLNDLFFFIRAHDGERTLLADEDDSQDTVTVSTGSFSTYALMRDSAVPLANIGAEKLIKGDNAKNGNIWMALFWGVVGLDCVFAVVYYMKRKNLMVKVRTGAKYFLMSALGRRELLEKFKWHLGSWK